MSCGINMRLRAIGSATKPNRQRAPNQVSPKRIKSPFDTYDKDAYRLYRENCKWADDFDSATTMLGGSPALAVLRSAITTRRMFSAPVLRIPAKQWQLAEFEWLPDFT